MGCSTSQPEATVPTENRPWTENDSVWSPEFQVKSSNQNNAQARNGGAHAPITVRHGGIDISIHDSRPGDDGQIPRTSQIRNSYNPHLGQYGTSPATGIVGSARPNSISRQPPSNPTLLQTGQQSRRTLMPPSNPTLITTRLGNPSLSMIPAPGIPLTNTNQYHQNSFNNRASTRHSTASSQQISSTSNHLPGFPTTNTNQYHQNSFNNKASTRHSPASSQQISSSSNYLPGVPMTNTNQYHQNNFNNKASTRHSPASSQQISSTSNHLPENSNHTTKQQNTDVTNTKAVPTMVHIQPSRYSPKNSPKSSPKNSPKQSNKKSPPIVNTYVADSAKVSPQMPVNSHHSNGNRPKRRFEDYYDVGMDLGKGAFARVFVGIEKASGRQFAVKKIRDRSKMVWHGRDALFDEISNLAKLRDAPHIVYLHDHFLDTEQCHMILELLPGKGFMERFIQKGIFTEQEARDACCCVLEALSYMHERRMTHRDLKPDNLLVVDEINLDKVKVSDFGFSKVVKETNGCRTLCGTPGYLAPEILERWPRYDMKCDVFSVGVIMFLLLGGYLPFDARGSNNVKKIFERTRNGQYHFYPQRWEGISSTAKDMIAKCLTVNPNQRLSAKEALSHTWMREGLALPTRLISTQSLKSAYEGSKRTNQAKKAHRQHQHHSQAKMIQKVEENQVDRLQELNDDFIIFLEDRQGDSIVSAMTGGKTWASNATVKFKEDSPSGQPFSTFYSKVQELGRGNFATVYRCIHKATGSTFAVKEIDTTKFSKRSKQTLEDEVVVLKFLRGAPNIIRLYDVFQESNTTLLILEEMMGGELLTHITAKEVYTEREAREICKVLFHAVHYCHKKRIAHRDIKLDNLLLRTLGDEESIKLVDFGFAKKVRHENGLSTFCGTPSYMAPEVLYVTAKGYDCSCDMWSVGVVVFALLGGYLPFEGTLNEVKGQILKGEYTFHDEYWVETSIEAKRLISYLLQIDPDRRIPAEKVLESGWMAMTDEELKAVDLSSTQKNLERLQKQGIDKTMAAARAIIGARRFNTSVDGKLGPILPEDVPLESLSGGEWRSFSGESIAESEGSDLSIEVQFKDVYKMEDPIGEGIFAKIAVGTNRITKTEYSVKKVVRKDLFPSDLAALNDEIAVLEELSKDRGGRHMIYLYEVYEDPDATYLVMEKISGDPLIDRLIQRRKYVEFDAKELIRNLLLGVNHCHQKKIAIRNMTLDNLLLPKGKIKKKDRNKGKDARIIITDFELAKKVVFPNSLRTQCGTQEFVAPEVLENRPAYDVSCDIWNVGVILFLLLGGYYPFRGKTDEEKLKNIRYGNYEMRESLWKGVSSEAREMVQRMMQVDPAERITAEAALASSWMQADHSSLSTSLKDNMVEMQKELIETFKAAPNSDVATQKLQTHKEEN